MERQGKPEVNPWLIAVSVMIATFMEVIDTSIASVAIPYIAGSVSATIDEATWVLTFYLMSNAVVLPASAWFSMRFGRKRFLMTCIVIFTVSSFACGAATSLVMILLARLVQGAGGGALQPISQAILTESFPPEKRGLATAIFALGVVVAPVLGPTLGGWLTDTYSWRWAFYINIPIGVLALFMINRFIEDPPYIKNAKPGKLDSIGLGLLAVWLGCLQLILDRGQEDDWFGATWIRYAFAVMLTCFALFVWRQLTHRKPLVDLTIFQNRNFALGSFLIFMFGAAIYGIVTLLPLYYQTLMGYSATSAGFVVSPRGIGAIVAMPFIGILTSKIDNRYLITCGFFIFAVCSLLLGRIDLDIGPWSMLWPVVISGSALGMVFVPLSTTALGDLPQEKIGNASGLYNLMRNVGGSVGISMVNTIVARHEQLHRVELARNLTPGSPAFEQEVSRLTQFMSAHAGPVEAARRAYGIIERTLTEQAQLWAYVDDFRYLAVACFACVPFVWMLKRVSIKGGIAAE
jgi:MFS transporter, DHA2 family, multidrug resistance protein